MESPTHLLDQLCPELQDYFPMEQRPVLVKDQPDSPGLLKSNDLSEILGYQLRLLLVQFSEDCQKLGSLLARL
jgi:hypothetical protein